MWREEFDSQRENYLGEIEGLMDSVLVRCSPDGSSLIDMSRYHLGTGGKRMRALLPIAVACAMDANPKELVPFGAACELLHNATLVHDDLQDGDEVRRGQPTIWAKFGDARAINLGDALLYYAVDVLSDVACDDATKLAVISRLVRSAVRVIDGQEREFLLQENAPDRASYFRMVEGKTSGLFALPFAGAVQLCGASNDTVARAESAASQLGVVFQIQDDVLDVFGSKGRDRIGTDIAEGKISALVVSALEMADPSDADWLSELLKVDRNDVTDEDIQRAKTLFETSGALASALTEIRDRSDAALELMTEPVLRDVIEYTLEWMMKPIAHLL